MADKQLLEQLARALKPGPVEPPAKRVKALRDLVGSRMAATNGRGDAQDLSRTNGALHKAADDGTQERAAAAVTGSAPYWPSVDPSPAADNPQRPGRAGGANQTVVPLERARSRRKMAAAVPRILSGAVAAAAVAILVAMVAAQDLPTPLREVAHGVGLPVDSTELVAARRDVDDLALALARQDAAKVAEADAAMLKSTNRLDGDDLQEVRPRAVKLHLEALAFLRDNPTPEALSDLSSPAPSSGIAQPSESTLPGGQPSPDGSAAPATQPPPPGSPGASPNSPVVTTPPVEPPTVTITSISPRLDATFQVEFEVAGFTPGPGQPYAIQFSFDNDQEPTTHASASPWRFSLLKAVRYRSLCARVVDAAGVVEPDSGNCLNILLL